MRVVGIMAAHQRPEITFETLVMLRERQTHPFAEIIVMGGPSEKACVMRAGCEFLQVPNRPLGRKYQCGLFWSRMYDPDAVMVLGSDTWLSPEWTAAVVRHMAHGADCCGKLDWHTCRAQPDQPVEILHVGYDPVLRNEPVGGGRTYSRRLLDRLDWDLFPIHADSNLDFLTLGQVHSVGVQAMIMTDPDVTVMGVKGPWPTLNRFEKLKNSRVLRHLDAISSPEAWLDTHFPGGRAALARAVPGVRIHHEM